MVETLTKVDIARIQLDRAVELFRSGLDYVSSITLAGAAEEILGELVHQQGQAHALDGLVTATAGTQAAQPPIRKGIVHRANYFRNGLKHLGNGVALTFDPIPEAKDILDRAVENYWVLTRSETPAMVWFKEQHLMNRR